MANTATLAAPRGLAFAALHHGDYRQYFLFSLLAMMADSIEHVITYWVLYEKFQSPVLAGFAVISHWAPFLFFSVYFGALADRYDCRRVIQAGYLLFMCVSVSWGVLFVTDTLEIWIACVLLVLHGVAGVIGTPAIQLIVHDMVGREHLQSAVRLNATARNLGILLGPGVGGALLVFLGANVGMFLNALLYVPMLIWLLRVPYTGHGAQTAERRGQLGVGLRDAVRLLRAISGNRPVMSMIVLGGATSFMVGNAFQAAMPEFAHDLGADSLGLSYSLLLAANAVGAVIGGILLETLHVFQSRPRTAVVLAALWCVVIAGFAAATLYPVALVLLLIAGVLNLSFNAMAQTIVQLQAPPELRGRVVGLFNMANLGLRVGSGFTVGVLGAAIGLHWSLGLSAAVMFLLALRLLQYLSVRKPAAQPAASAG